MYYQGDIVDGSWELSILVTDLQVEKTLRVKGDLHIGGCMFKLVESLDIAMDWSDHALWWPEKNMWLKKPRLTLDQYGVQADAKLEFTPMHKNIRLQMPDLQILDVKVDFSVDVFKSVIVLCKELGVHHPEELSISRKLGKEDLKYNNANPRGLVQKKHRDRMSANGNLSSNSSNHLSNTSMDGSGSPFISRSPMTPSTPQGTLLRGPGSSQYSPSTPWAANGTMSSMHSLSFEGALESTLRNSPQRSVREAFTMLPRPKTFQEKARINCGWLDSSRSLMEQLVRENDVVLLKFKFYAFYDLNTKYGLVRINQIYEQAKWSMISEELDCTTEEMIVFAALQLQIQLQADVPQADVPDGMKNEDDDVASALKDLELHLEGSSSSPTADITHIPELSDYLDFIKPKKLTLKSTKRYYFTFRNTTLSLYRSPADKNGSPLMYYNMNGCEVHHEVNIAVGKYAIKLSVPVEDGMTEIQLRCDNEDQYAKWMAACRLASSGKTMADSSYETEVQSLQNFLKLQHPAKNGNHTSAPAVRSDQIQFNPEELVAPRFLKKFKSKQLQKRILEAHANFQDLSLLEAKMQFIRTWQELPEFGITYFIVKFKGEKKEELLGVAFNRLIRCDMNTGEALKTWRYSAMKSWDVNWDIKMFMIQHEEANISFSCLTADCKVVHEFIGGYIFNSLRKSDRSQTLDEEMFHKLTGGWD
ncbi:fermitin family homolog 2-like [Lineus longissimus]|uniref:fermitin family homolog 2-like n=1 Tax=Lineus longissimus TaxID=88925 RepID=UPI002B4DFDC9